MISTIFLKSACILFSAILQLAYEQQQMSNIKEKKVGLGDTKVPGKEEAYFLCGLIFIWSRSRPSLNSNILSLCTNSSYAVLAKCHLSSSRDSTENYFLTSEFVGTYFLCSHKQLNKDLPAAHCGFLCLCMSCFASSKFHGG